MGKIEDTFNIPSLSEIEEMRREMENMDDNHEIQNITQNPFQVMEDANQVIDLTQHNAEMDEIANQCLKDYTDIIELGKDLDARNIGSVLQTASSIMDIALKARMSKVDAKLRAIALTTQKNKNQPKKDDTIPVDGVIMDRNALLAELEKIKP